MGHDLITIYWLKALEYILALSYLPLFVLFWRFVTPKAPAAARVPAAAPGWADQLAGYFQLPAQLFFHPGHAWARVDGDDTVTIGMDDFAQRLVGPMDRLRLPAAGSALIQGAPALVIESGNKTVEMLSPVGGTVLAVNEAAAAAPRMVKHSPYGEGWLLRVRSPQLAANLKHLMSGAFARRWMDTVTEQLCGEMGGGELGHAYLDGGTPIDGMARGLAQDGWDRLARRYLLTEEGGDHA